VDETTLRGLLNQPLMLRQYEEAGLFEDREFPKDLFAPWKVPLRKYYSPRTQNLFQTDYTYDFGDNWAHDILFEGEFPAIEGTNYPTGTDGERACPPEDCGGIRGFENLLINLKKEPSQRTEDEKELLDWLHGHMQLPNNDPDFFNPAAVKFMNPRMWLAFKREAGFCGTSNHWKLN